jgi:hypothetical protein
MRFEIEFTMDQVNTTKYFLRKRYGRRRSIAFERLCKMAILEAASDTAKKIQKEQKKLNGC